MSNAERQRQFRERNPGYYQRLHAKRRAAVKAYGERLQAIAAIHAMIARRPPLMLPAPVETIEIPGMSTIRIATAEAIATSPVTVPLQAANPLAA